MDESIFHVAVEAEWIAGRAGGVYRAAELAESGFLHAAYVGQVPEVLERLDGEEPRVLLAIAPDRLHAPVQDVVDPASGKAFPHILGPINRDAVVEVRPLHVVPERDDLRPGARPQLPGRSRPILVAGLVLLVLLAVIVVVLAQ